jgi:NAD(P)-dependent dehydrogenase (short-subunit alcohol dehydrogenase family)
MKAVAVVSGIASGIGRCIAESFNDHDIEVFGLDKNKTSLANVKCYQCDVGKETDVLECIERITAAVSKIDYLVNAAGIFCYENRYFIEDLPLCEWEKVFEANLTSVFLMTKYSIPLLKKSEKGSIINFSSEQVVLAQTKSVPYAVTKAAIEMFTKITAMELLNEKIRVNTIALASVETNFIKSYIKDDKKIDEMMLKSETEMPFGLIKSKDIFDLVQYLLGDNNKMTGQTLLIDSGVILDANKKARK